MDDTPFQIPIPVMPDIPQIVIPQINLPQQINFPPIILHTPDISQMPPAIKVDPQPENIIGCRFDVASFQYEDLNEYIRSVTYKYKPKEIVLVLKEVKKPCKSSIFKDWIYSVMHSKDDLKITTLDSKHMPFHENEFLGCSLKEHHCTMDHMSGDVACHHVTLSYEHLNYTKININKEKNDL